MENSEKSESRSGIQVIARAAAVLRELKGNTSGMSIGQIAERLELPRSTVQRIVGAPALDVKCKTLVNKWKKVAEVLAQ